VSADLTAPELPEWVEGIWINVNKVKIDGMLLMMYISSMDDQVPMFDEDGQLMIVTMFSLLMIPFYERIILPPILGRLINSGIHKRTKD